MRHQRCFIAYNKSPFNCASPLRNSVSSMAILFCQFDQKWVNRPNLYKRLLHSLTRAYQRRLLFPVRWSAGQRSFCFCSERRYFWADRPASSPKRSFVFWSSPYRRGYSLAVVSRHHGSAGLISSILWTSGYRRERQNRKFTVYGINALLATDV